jgi:DNA-binding transcriptional ArsR family regulator
MRRKSFRVAPFQNLVILPNNQMISVDISVRKRVAVLKALAHPSRLLITERLMSGEACVGQLRELVGDDVSTVSKHLFLLRTAGVLECEKRGLNVYYRLACDCFGEFLQCVDQVCGTPRLSRKTVVTCC